ncbi:ribonuclease inhibitor-like [Amblyraja radiata]|uniref:ribonuclease inhibitor-like n=1 Tax=Amblyraja radiata TaxID=386614 RepID=UPI001402AEB1|nr:ribonuclease inhibitor-like [Amblyraja radiata]
MTIKFHFPQNVSSDCYRLFPTCGGILTQVGNVFKRLWPGTSSKNDGQNTGTMTEKQSGIESRTSMECEAAEEEREQCQSRERGIGDVVHAPGTESSDEIHHDRDSSNKDSSSPIQGAGPDPQEYMNIIGGLTELPSHMEGASTNIRLGEVIYLSPGFVSVCFLLCLFVFRLGVNKDLGDSGVKLVSDALRNPDCKIQTLWLDSVGLTDSGAKDLVSALSTNHTVTELNLSGNKLGDSGVKLVSDALRNPDCKIQILGLDSVGLTDSGAEDLVSALSTNHTVTDLVLSGNKLGDSGVKLVSDALRNPDCKIQTLWLDSVGLTDSGAKDLASALITNHTVTELYLSGNKLGDSGVKLVSDALRNPDCKIQRLGLYSVGLTDSGAEDLVSALSTNTSLTELDLTDNSLTDRCVPALRRLILTLPSLERIWLEGNKFSADGQNQLQSLRGTRRGLSVDV